MDVALGLAGHEPDADGLGPLLAAVGEEPVVAASVQPWRVVQLAPDRAFGQVRWYPGCATRTLVGYADPLDLAAAQRAVSEHRGTDEEWQALRPAQEVADREVDPLTWRLSSLAFAAGIGR